MEVGGIASGEDRLTDMGEQREREKMGPFDHFNRNNKHY